MRMFATKNIMQQKRWMERAREGIGNTKLDSKKTVKTEIKCEAQKMARTTTTKWSVRKGGKREIHKRNGRKL